jgi:hypothetical protein
MLITNDKKIDATLEKFYNRYNKYNTKVLQTLGNVIKQFDGLTPSQAHQLAQELRIGYDLNELQLELSRISGKSVEDVNKLLDKVAKENVEFSEVYYKAKNKEYVKYEDNEPLQDLVESIKMQTNETFVNLAQSKNTGFVIEDSDGNKTFKTIPQVYNDLIDEAVYQVSTGVEDYQSAMRNITRQLADSGVKIHEEKVAYQNGYNKRIDSAVRQDVLTGLRQVNIGVQQEIGDDLDANGIEVSFHVPCADDHWEINGKQYKARQGEDLDQLLDRINSKLDRPIGTMNCTHFVFSIIYGVQEANYSKEYIKKQKQLSKETTTYNGKKYTPYEATQVQRKLETAIRQQKDRQIIARASGDNAGISNAQAKITQLTDEYNNFSKSMGLDTYKNRLVVSGYNRLKSYDK